VIDTHCHLDDPRLAAELPSLLGRARAADVNRFIVAGTGMDEWPCLQQLCREESGIYAAYGIHPWYCNQHKTADLDTLARFLESAVALGECGLDAIHAGADHETQLWWLRCQLRLAAELELPLILHCVRNSEALLRELTAYPGLRGVVHGFSGSLEEALRFTAAGFHIGIGAMVLREQAKKMQRLAAAVPIERLLLETDSPDGLPDGELNEPSNLPRIAASVAALRDTTADAIIAASDSNAMELFRL